MPANMFLPPHKYKAPHSDYEECPMHKRGDER